MVYDTCILSALRPLLGTGKAIWPIKYPTVGFPKFFLERALLDDAKDDGFVPLKKAESVCDDAGGTAASGADKRGGGKEERSRVEEEERTRSAF